jgi:uncharacterized protein (TIGR03083 family)
MDDTRFLASLEADGEGLADAADIHLDASIPACPAWTMADLVWHVGQVHEFWREVVDRKLTDLKHFTRDERPSEAGLLSWYRHGVTRLVDVLTAADPDAHVWTWSSQHDVGFVIRRMAQETAVHRWDAEDAIGGQHVIPTDLAADGIDEFLQFFTARKADGAAPLGGTVHVHTTDIEGEWLVGDPRPDRDGNALSLSYEHAKGDAALRGTAETLLLALWRRRTIDDLEVFGDRAIAERLLAHTALD